MRANWVGVVAAGVWVLALGGAVRGERVMVGTFTEAGTRQGELAAWAMGVQMESVGGVESFSAGAFARDFEGLKIKDVERASAGERAELARYTGCGWYVSGKVMESKTGITVTVTLMNLRKDEAARRVSGEAGAEGFFAGMGKVSAEALRAMGVKVSAERAVEMERLLTGSAGCVGALSRAAGATGTDRTALVTEAAKADEGSSAAGFLLAEELAAQGKRLEAISGYRKVLKERSGWRAAHYDLGNVYFDEGRWGEAAEEYGRALGLDGEYGPAHENLVRALRKSEGTTEKTLARYRQLTAGLGENGLVQMTAGRLEHELGRKAEAEQALREAARLRPGDAVVHYDLGEALEAAGKTGEAKGEYLKALEISPNYAKAHNNAGFLYEREGKLEVAIFHYVQAVKFDPGYARGWTNLGVAYERKGSLELAADAERKVVELTPGSGTAHFNLGVTYHKMKEYGLAAVEYKKAVELDGKDKLAHCNLAEVYERLGRTEEAIVEWETVLKLGPEEKEAKTAKAHIEAMKNAK